MESFDLIVVGGGPAGMIAAGRAAERGRRVLLLEKGPSLGRKLLLTATGRCNVTNSAPLEEFVRAYASGGDFLRDALSRFGPRELIEWLHARGVETVEERKGRVFPATQSARTILDCLVEYMREGGVKILFGVRAKALQIANGKVTGVETDGRHYEGRCTLVATGGLSYPATGCTGDGYVLARQAGHTVTPIFPSLVAFETAELWPQRVEGVPIKNVAAVAMVGGRTVARGFGEGLFTRYGVSGPLILDMSRKIVMAMKEGGEARLRLDLRPSDTPAEFERRLIEAARDRGAQRIHNILKRWIPDSLARVMLENLNVDPKEKMGQCGRAARRAIVQGVKRLSLTLVRPRPIEEAIVTAGGVSLREVDPRTMGSRLVQGLFFAGEVLDIDGPSGGFNLQAAFSTGWLVGESV